jgi:hypothetical protein
MKITKKITLAILGTVALSFGILIASPALAQTTTPDPALNPNNPLAGSGQTPDTLGLSTSNLKTSLGNVIKTVLGFMGIIAVGLVIYGGIVWMTAAGDDGKIEDAKKIIYSAILGLIIILFSYAITTFVLGAVK